jgi:hypothetical protein
MAQSDDREVALFTIPGPHKPWSSVIDVRSASRLHLPEPDTTAAGPAPAPELPLNEPPPSPQEAMLPADLDLPVEGRIVTLTGPGLEAFPSESWFHTPDASPARTAHPDTNSSQSPEIGFEDDYVEPRHRLTAASAALGGAVTAAAAATRQRLATWPSAVIGSTAGALSAGRSAVAHVPLPRARHVTVGAVAAAVVVIVVGVGRVALVRFTDAARVTIATLDNLASRTASDRLPAAPLSVVATLAPALDARARRDETTDIPAVQPSPATTTRTTAPTAAPARASIVPPAPRPVPGPAPTTRAAAAPPRSESRPAPALPLPPVARTEVADEGAITPMVTTADDEVRPAPAETAAAPMPVAEPRPDPAPAAGAARPATAAAVVDSAPADGINAALRSLQAAYERRDAKLVKAVWPSVDERALARAFDGLRSQHVTFDRCQLDVKGTAGEVECRGVTTYVPRIGGQDTRTESRQWKFRVQKGDDHWLIMSAAAR